MEKDRKEERKQGRIWPAIAIVVIGLIALVYLVENTGKPKESKARKAAENREKGFHCLSNWDGSHREFVSATKRMMNDPDSFEHVETRVTPRDESGRHTIVMEFTGKNYFGGRARYTATGGYSSTTCAIVSGSKISAR